MKRLISILLPTLALVSPLACGSSDPDTTPAHEEAVNAPELSNLRISDVATVGEPVPAVVHAADADGLKDITLRVKFTVNSLSVEAENKLETIPAQILSADIDLTLTLPNPQPAEYDMELTAIDVDGNESNTLTATITTSE